MERTPTSTATTPAMPKIAASAAPMRAGSERRLKPMRAATCANQFMSLSPQRFDGVEAHGLEGRQRAGHNAEHDGQDRRVDDGPRSEQENGERSAGGIAGGNKDPS